MKSVFRGRMTHRVTEHQTRTLSYDVTSALKRTFILRPFLSLLRDCDILKIKQRRYNATRKNTFTLSEKALNCEQEIFYFQSVKDTKWDSADLVETQGSSLFFTRNLDFENAERKRCEYIWQTGILDQQRMEECPLYSLLSCLCVPSQFLVPMKI